MTTAKRPMNWNGSSLTRLRDGGFRHEAQEALQAPMVPEAGIEPARVLSRGILSPLRLPISPLRHWKGMRIVAQLQCANGP